MNNKLDTFIKLIKGERHKIPVAIYNNLINLGITNVLNDELFLKLSYKIKFGQPLELNNPKTFNEKMQWLKLYYRHYDLVKLVDKIEVKDYVKKVIGEKYVIPTLGVWDNVEDIDIDNLPEKFVLKCNHDSGSVVICRDKNQFDLDSAKKHLKKSLSKDYYSLTREWAYKQVKPKIFAEKYMESQGNEELIDYKFFCFHGEPKFLYVSRGLSNHETATIDFYDMNYSRLPVKRTDYKSAKDDYPKPESFEQMVVIAEQLSRDLPFVRLDLYDIDGKIYFSEFTLYASAGWLPFEPKEWDYKLGKYLDISKIKRGSF